MKTGKIAVFCLVVLGLLCSCVSKPSGPTKLDFSAQYIRTDSLMVEDGDHCVVIRTAEELENYCAAAAKDREQFGDAQEFLKACERYDEEYFKKSLLIIAVLWEGTGSNRHEVARVARVDTALQVEIEVILPPPEQSVTDDIAQWHILIEVKRNAVGKGDVEIELVQADDYS